MVRKGLRHHVLFNVRVRLRVEHDGERGVHRKKIMINVKIVHKRKEKRIRDNDIPPIMILLFGARQVP